MVKNPNLLVGGSLFYCQNLSFVQSNREKEVVLPEKLIEVILI